MLRFSTVFAWFTLLGYDYICFVNMSVVIPAGLLAAWLLTRSKPHGNLTLGRSNREFTQERVV